MTADCLGSTATPVMAVLANGVDDVNDAIFQGEVFNSATSLFTGVGATPDGDLDSGVQIPILTSTGGELRGVRLQHAAPPNGPHAVINAISRTKGSPGPPTQGHCAFIGGVVVASAP